MARRAIPADVRREVLAEAGYRCAVPTCRGILALDLHHLIEVADDGPNTAANLLALCPTCHALVTRGTIGPDAIYAYKRTLVALSAAFDVATIDLLGLLASAAQKQQPMIVSGGSLARYAGLISAGYADWRLLANNANQIVTYGVWLTERGVLLFNAWVSGQREQVREVLGPEPS